MSSNLQGSHLVIAFIPPAVRRQHPPGSRLRLRIVAVCGLSIVGLPWGIPALQAQVVEQIPARLVCKIPFVGHSQALSRDGKRLAIGGSGGHIQIFDALTGMLVAKRYDEQSKGMDHAYIECVAFSPDGELLVSTAQIRGDAPTLVRVWDVNERESQVPLKKRKKMSGLKMSFEGHKGKVFSACFSPDGKYLASAAGSRNDETRLWDVKTGREVAQVDAGQGIVWNVIFRQDGTRLVTNANDKKVHCYEILANGSAPAAKSMGTGDLPSHAHRISLHPSGDLVAAGCRDNNNVIVMDVNTGKVVAEWGGHTARVWDVAFDRGGSRLASSSPDGNARIWDTQTGKCLATIAIPNGANALCRVALGPNGQRLYVLTRYGAFVWELIAQNLEPKEPEVLEVE